MNIPIKLVWLTKYMNFNILKMIKKIKDIPN